MNGFTNSLFRLTIGATLTALMAFSQTQPQGRVLGVVTDRQGMGAKVKTDQGDLYEVVFAPQAKFQRIAPGQTSLKDAAEITMNDIAVGDRVLARGTQTDPKTIVALSVIQMSQSDLAARQQKERQEWQRRGIAGTVTAVNAAAKEITIRLPQLGATEQLVKVTLKDNAPARRYAQDSVRFADAKVAPLTDVKQGDQLRARGDKSEDGAKFSADEIVTGSFQTLALNVVAVNAETKELQVKNLDTNKTMTVRFTSDSVLRRIPERMAGMMGGGPGGPGGAFGGGRGPGGPSAGPGGPGAGERPQGERPAEGAPNGPGAPGAGPGGRGMGGGGFGGRTPDLSQMFERMPTAQLDDVKVGETVIVAGTRGAAPDRITAISMLANAEAFVNMRRMMAARAAAQGGGQGAGPGGNWSLGDMGSMMPMQ